MFILPDTETDTQTEEIDEMAEYPMTSMTGSRCNMNTLIQFYPSHFNRSRSVSVSFSGSVNVPLRFQSVHIVNTALSSGRSFCEFQGID